MSGSTSSKAGRRRSLPSRKATRRSRKLNLERFVERTLLAADLSPVVDYVTDTDWAGVYGTGGWTDRAYDVALQDDGKILAAGVVAKSPLQSSQDMLLTRYNSDGSIDSSFNGSGSNSVDFGANFRDIATNVAIQADGKIVVAGLSVDYDGSGNYMIASRFNNDGTLDESFIAQPFADHRATDGVLALSSGKTLILSNVRQAGETTNDVLLTRLNADFTLDTSFAMGGHAVHDFQNQGNNGWELAEQSDGKILVAGGAQQQGYVARFNADGSLDTSYADGVGHKLIDTSSVGKNNFLNLVIDASDNAYLTGVSDVNADGSDREVIVVKLDANGDVDIGFGTAGVVRNQLATGVVNLGEDIVLDSLGRIVVAASSDHGFMFRLDSNGNFDSDFGNLSPRAEPAQLHGLVVDASDRPIAVGEIANTTLDVWLTRVNPNVAFGDSFEQGQWNGNWVEDSQNDWFTSTQRSTAGNYSAEVDGRANNATLTISNPVDLSAYDSAQLRFDWLIESSFDGGEYLRLEFFDGSGWNVIDSLDGNSDAENTWHSESIDIPSQYLVQDFRFRFSAKASRSNEDANVDNVKLVGTRVPANSAPTAVDDSLLTAEDQVAAIDVLANDSDPEGDALSIKSVSQPISGSTVIVGGQVEYTPDANFHGSDSFAYTIEDSAGNTATATVELTITPINDAPMSVDDSITTMEDTPVTFPVLTNDSDVDGDSLSVDSITDGANGSVVINADDSLTYFPASGFFGVDQFTYTAVDGHGGSSTATVTVTVEEQNDPPTAINDLADTPEDVSISIDVLANDSDPDGDTLGLLSVTQPSFGSASIADGRVQYLPNLNYHGNDSLTYTVVDSAGNEATANIDITVTQVNDAPNAEADGYTLDQDTTLDVSVSEGLLANDSDVEGDALTVSLVAGPASGSLNLNADGSFVYSPNSGYVGSDSFTYQAVDTSGAVSQAATVSLQVNEIVAGPNLTHGVIEGVTGGWQTVSLSKPYTSAVIVATPRYNNGSGPGVVRISNVTSTSFDVRVDSVGNTAFDGGIHFIATEEGVYDVPGQYKLEAVKATSTATSGKTGGWQIESQSYQQSYSNPVVVGQVMSTYNEDWSVFWSSSSSRTSPATSSALNVGKHVGEDSSTTRVPETIGYFVIESTGLGTIDGFKYSAGVGGDTVRGVENGTYRYSNVTPTGASTAVLSTAGMDGSDGGWAALMGNSPLASAGGIDLAVDEDQKRDSERKHTTEQVAYFVIGELTGEGEAGNSLAVPEITVHDPMDVNGDGYISPIDALAVINSLNSKTRMEEGDMALDTNSDGQLSAIDALLVVNHLNASSTAAEGESTTANDSLVDGYFASLDEDDEDDLLGFRLD